MEWLTQRLRMEMSARVGSTTLTSEICSIGPAQMREALCVGFDIHLEQGCGTAALYAHAAQVHLDPCGAGLLLEQIGLRPGLWLCRVFDSQPALLIQLAKIGDHALPRPTRGSVGLDQSPIGMPFSILAPVAASHIHTAILRIRSCFTRGLVFTTRNFTIIAIELANTGSETKTLLPAFPGGAA